MRRDAKPGVSCTVKREVRKTSWSMTYRVGSCADIALPALSRIPLKSNYPLSLHLPHFILTQRSAARGRHAQTNLRAHSGRYPSATLRRLMANKDLRGLTQSGSHQIDGKRSKGPKIQPPKHEGVGGSVSYHQRGQNITAISPCPDPKGSAGDNSSLTRFSRTFAPGLCGPTAAV